MLILKATVVNCCCASRRAAGAASVLQNFLLRGKFPSAAYVEPARKMSWANEKQRFLNMSPEEKRSFYKAEVITPDQIPTWAEYWDKNKSSIVKTVEKVEKIDEAVAKKVSIWQGDITLLEIDAIVNAANSSLLGGGGVDGAIHRAAGPNLRKECATLGGCKVGEAKITGGYMLPAKYIIHTVGPQGEKPDKLKECYENSLVKAKENHLRTIAFPCISTGIYGYPQRPAAKVALSTVKKFLLDNKDLMDRIIFCLFLETDKDIYEELLQKYFALD
ncbi:macro domain-containing protein CT2219 [Monomorium pharaonis]|uniref:macro domain-containing protein CT2219 n=1 Tax=Monomorium pharaonis TaxID=307658 RepID=UPI00174757E4|nr:macro domain-containing protein CT2219 [Monomorium pharaonis]